VYRNGVPVHQRNLFVSTVQQAFFEQSDLPGFGVGDSIGLWMRLTASAGATNEPPVVASASADLGGSGRLYLDVLSGNASFQSTSGHDYSLAPEPTGPATLAVVWGVLAGALRRPRGGLRPPSLSRTVRSGRPVLTDVPPAPPPSPGCRG
jgi:hypothetical protein